MGPCTIVNLDKRQCLHPEAFGDCQGRIQFSLGDDGVMFGLALLLNRDAQRRLPADWRALVGSWAGDCVVVGDCTPFGELTDEFEPERLSYRYARGSVVPPPVRFVDISAAVAALMEVQRRLTADASS